MSFPVFALLCAVSASAAPAWRENISEALKEARDSGKPVLMDFQAPWCYSCYYMEKHVLYGAGFSKAAEGLVLLRIDVDREEGHALKESYQVGFLPTFVLADSRGQARGRIVGEQTEGDFLRALDSLRKETQAKDALDGAVEPLRQRLAAGEYERAAQEIAELPRKRLEVLRARKDWPILTARLELMLAVKLGLGGGSEALKALLRLEDSCELAYDVGYADKLVDGLKPEPRRELLESERSALEKLVESRFFADASKRCADFRTGIEDLAAVYEKLGEKDRRTELLKRAVAFLDAQGPKPGEDRSLDDNLRFFLELSGDEPRLREHFMALMEAYPSDYVYAYRFARHLQERGKSEEALAFIEKADKLAYGANRLSVTKVRAKILAELGRKDEALALLGRDIKAGRKAFPKEAEGLSSLLEEFSRKGESKAPATK